MSAETKRAAELLGVGMFVGTLHLVWVSDRFATEQGSGGLTLLFGCTFVTAVLWFILMLRSLAADKPFGPELDDGGGWTFERESPNRKCGMKDQATGGIRTAEFNQGRQAATDAFAVLFPNTSRTLYTLATGNNSYDVDNPAIIDLPSSAMRVIPNVSGGVVTVGAALDGNNKAPFSSYASSQANVDIYAPGVNWTVLMSNGLTCTDTTIGISASTCNALTCRKPTGELLSGCVAAPCATEGNTAVCQNTGTSFAAPAVAGTAALLLSSTLRLRGAPSSLRTSLIDTATPVADFALCGSERSTGRLLDADAFLVANPP